LRRIWILAAAATGACQQSSTPQAGATVRQPPLRLVSTIAEIRIVRAGQVPPNPTRVRLDPYCSSYAVPHPRTAAGRLAATKGWIVTSETKLGRYDALTFVGALDPSTSATCAHVDGNLAIFDGRNLKALAYRPRSSKGGAPDPALGIDAVAEDSLGSARQVDPRRIRLFFGLPSPPFADVVVGNGISIERVAANDRVCAGAAVVPNVFGQDIREARKALIAHGWQSQRPDEPDTGSERLRRQGVPEVEACSGTGYGFCSFNYRHRQGFRLNVVTMGDEDEVVGVEASCAGYRAATGTSR
jgi:hypothetical protein